jgi:hypothetical protein
MLMKTDFLEREQLLPEDRMSGDWFAQRDWIALGEKPCVSPDVRVEVRPDARKLIETFVAHRNR